MYCANDFNYYYYYYYYYYYCRDATGKFPEYPDEETGGSAAIFKKREEPDPNEENEVISL